METTASGDGIEMKKALRTVAVRQVSTEINLGDYLRACSTLNAAPEVRVEIARLLGIELAFEQAPTAETPGPTSVPPELPDNLPTPHVSRTPQSIEPPITPPPKAKLRQQIVESGGEDNGLPADLIEEKQTFVDSSFEQLPEIPADEVMGAEPEFPTLFQPQQTRALLGRALARRAYTGPWDLTRVIEQCARGEAITEAPRLPEPSLAAGVQLLVDRSESMMIFSHDKSHLEEAIRKLVGNDKLQVLSFDGFPATAGTGGKRRWKRYEEQLPPMGTVVALLTDLGIGHASWMAEEADFSRWKEFAERLRRRGCPVVAFVPYPPVRWPERLCSTLTIIRWDRPTRTSTIRASVGPGSRVNP